ncbi:MAG: hypothetical protein K9J16_13355 [Melioribacteraceae bacterium]|nr:hypothetical protein [Melioribacteraceae bacterium]MCF8355309.1 hypothetical protein [Melioribacteraceae bacterium]MCF8396435.1 hypothetical protein [Melioribacteraceae bacterium]MCF8420387.1 hypothetical protein [Melioribacteraceae bacterium]
MNEKILNIYLVINDGIVTAFRAKSYEMDGDDYDKIEFLKSRAVHDFENTFQFEAPTNKHGKFMQYKKFARLEQQGMHFQLFEEIFTKFRVPENPLICVTPVVDGEIYSDKK